MKPPKQPFRSVLTNRQIDKVKLDLSKGKSLKLIARELRTSTAKLAAVLEPLGLYKRKKLPLTNESLAQLRIDEITSVILEQKRIAAEEAADIATEEKQKADAESWAKFQANTLQPFLAALKEFTPPKPPNLKKIEKVAGSDIFVIGAFDWHFGAVAEEEYLYKGKAWNLERAQKAVQAYIEKIQGHLKKEKGRYKKAVVLFGGDLYHTLTGETSNGTVLETDCGPDRQFKAVMEAMYSLCVAVSVLVPAVEVHFVRGNHGGVTDIPIGYAVKYALSPIGNINFTVYSQRTAVIELDNVLLLFEHGASHQTKSLIPREGAQREKYIQSLLLVHPEKLVGKKQRIFVMGDQHHYKQTEYGEFEFFQFGALPCGDIYADAKNLHNRARQNCLTIDASGVSSVHHFYLDEV